jgi:hypothetical protein
MCFLRSIPQTDCSLGIIKPNTINDIVIEKVSREWKPKWKALFAQQKLFGPDQKPLEKIPYKFSIKYTCEDNNCKGHTMMIEDWEICQLYRAMRDKFQDEDIALEKVKEKIEYICGPDKDLYFFVGTVLKYGSYIILGFFYPKK